MTASDMIPPDEKIAKLVEAARAGDKEAEAQVGPAVREFLQEARAALDGYVLHQKEERRRTLRERIRIPAWRAEACALAGSYLSVKGGQAYLIVNALLMIAFVLLSLPVIIVMSIARVEFAYGLQNLIDNLQERVDALSRREEDAKREWRRMMSPEWRAALKGEAQP